MTNCTSCGCRPRLGNSNMQVYERIFLIGVTRRLRSLRDWPAPINE